MIKNKISIILPVYNSEEYIGNTIESVLNQTLTNFELIIINDGSTDNTDKICKKYTTKNSKIKYFYIENSGVSNARNYALSKVEGEYITFLDSDDLYHKDYLEILLKNLKKYQADLVTCAYETLSKPPKIINHSQDIYTSNFKDYIETLQPKLLINQLWNKIYLTKIIKKNNLRFDTKIDLGEDYKFNLEYLSLTHNPIYINEPLYQYRITDSGLGFKYRPNSPEIKLSLLNTLEKIYLERNYHMTYINKSYLIQFIAYLSNIIDKRNKITPQEKLTQIKQLLNNQKYITKLKEIKKTSNLKYKLICNILLIKNNYLLYLIGILANKYDKYQKRKTYH